MGRPRDASVGGLDPTSCDARPWAYLYACEMREGKHRHFLARILT